MVLPSMSKKFNYKNAFPVIAGDLKISVTGVTKEWQMLSQGDDDAAAAADDHDDEDDDCCLLLLSP